MQATKFILLVTPLTPPLPLPSIQLPATRRMRQTNCGVACERNQSVASACPRAVDVDQMIIGLAGLSFIAYKRRGQLTMV
jgi:hypothetical protein